MNNIDELIIKHCPNGVEYKSIRDILKIKNGKDYKHLGDGNVPVYGSGGIMTYVNEFAYDKPSVLIPRKGSIDKLYYVDTPFWTVDTIFYTEINTDIVVPKFVYYILQKEHLERLNTAGGVPSLTQSVLNEVKVPVPPMEVQREIVQILDKFTLLSTELSAELSVELSARRKQYAYYVDKMFSDENVEIRTLDEVAEIIDSLHATPKYTENGYSMIRVADIKGGYVDTKNALKVDDQTYIEFIKRYKPQFNDIIVSRVGSFGNFSLVPDEDICLGQNVALIHPKINNKYLYYYLNSFYVKDYIEQKAHGGGYKNIGIKDLMKIPVKLHTEEEREKIARILEKFDVINSNMDEGIPAEIEARRKQYEYYRDKLLSFKNANE